MTARLLEIGRLTGINPRNALASSGIGGALLARLLDEALSGRDAAAIVAAVGAPEIVDGYRRRPLEASDVEPLVTFVRQARQRVRDRDRALDAQVAEYERLLELLAPAHA